VSRDAIELTSLYDLSGKSRDEMIFDKEKLLSVYDQTKDLEPPRWMRERDVLEDQTSDSATGET
jgi:NADH-quinone oxidoreductase subunit I